MIVITGASDGLGRGFPKNMEVSEIVINRKYGN